MSVPPLVSFHSGSSKKELELAANNVTFLLKYDSVPLFQRIFDVKATEEHITFKYHDYPTLRKIIDESTLSNRQLRLLRINLGRILRTLKRLHIVHRKITPTDLFVHDVRTMDIRLGGFGCAVQLPPGQNHIITGEMCGRRGFFAPEMYELYTVSHKADIFGAGATLFNAATGRYAKIDEVDRRFKRAGAPKSILGDFNERKW